MKGRRLVIFIVGPASYTEVRAAHDLAAALGREVLLGATSLQTPEEYLARPPARPFRPALPARPSAPAFPAILPARPVQPALRARWNYRIRVLMGFGVCFRCRSRAWTGPDCKRGTGGRFTQAA